MTDEALIRLVQSGHSLEQATAIVAILKTSHVPGRINNMSSSACGTCGGTGWTYDFPRDAGFPRDFHKRPCVDCGGTGRRAVVDDDEFVLPGDERPDPPDED